MVENPGAAAEEPWVVPNKGLRSKEAIWADTPEDHRFPKDMPLGPWGTFGRDGIDAAVKDYLTPWAQNRGLDGGGHSIAKKHLTVAKAGGEKGARQDVVCECHGPPPPPNPDAKRAKVSVKTNCPFGFVMEESSQGWVVARMNPGSIRHANESGGFHNHPLTQTLSEANAAPGGKQRKIPLDLEKIGKDMAEVHCSVSTIFETLARMCKNSEREVTFDHHDVRNAYGATTAERASDANSLILALRNREKLQGLAWDFEIDAQEGLTRVWWEMKVRHFPPPLPFVARVYYVREEIIIIIIIIKSN